MSDCAQQNVRLRWHGGRAGVYDLFQRDSVDQWPAQTPSKDATRLLKTEGSAQDPSFSTLYLTAHTGNATNCRLLYWRLGVP